MQRFSLRTAMRNSMNKSYNNLFYNVICYACVGVAVFVSWLMVLKLIVIIKQMIHHRRLLVRLLKSSSPLHHRLRLLHRLSWQKVRSIFQCNLVTVIGVNYKRS